MYFAHFTDLHFARNHRFGLYPEPILVKSQLRIKTDLLKLWPSSTRPRVKKSTSWLISSKSSQNRFKICFRLTGLWCFSRIWKKYPRNVVEGREYRWNLSMNSLWWTHLKHLWHQMTNTVNKHSATFNKLNFGLGFFLIIEEIGIRYGPYSYQWFRLTIQKWLIVSKYSKSGSGGLTAG